MGTSLHELGLSVHNLLLLLLLLLLHGHLVYGATPRTESKRVIGASTMFSIGGTNAADATKLVPTASRIRVTHMAGGRHHVVTTDHEMAAVMATSALEVTTVLPIVRLDRVRCHLAAEGG